MKKAIGSKNWVIAAVLSFVLAALMIFSFFAPIFSGRGSVAAAEDSPVTVDDADGVKKYIVNETVRVTPISETVVRLEEKGPNGFEDRETYYVIGRDEFTAPDSSVQAIGPDLVISTDNYIVHIPCTATTLEGVYVTDASAEPITLYKYNGVTLANTYLPSPSDDLRGWYFSDHPRIVPGDRGYTVHDDGLELNGWDFENEAPDVYVFVPDDYKQFCKDYVTLTGKSNLVDLKTLGYWDSRWYVYDDETALQQIQDYLDKGYSIDILVIDTNWRKGEVNQTPGMDPAVGGMGYEIDTDLFPNMAKFLEQAHKMGVNIIFNDHPEPTRGNTNGLQQEEIEYRTNGLTGILELGLDMWWYDRNWHTALNSADEDLSVFAWGMYAFQFIENQYYEELAEKDKLQEFARRAIIMGNVDGCLNGVWKYGSDLTAHRYTIQWTGDIGADENALNMEIRNAIFGSAENGIPYVSSDLGGHTSAVTDDLYTRWMQYGALATITRVHCTNVNYLHQEGRMPWLFGDTAEAVTKEYVGMKYNLMPVYYSLAGENANTGTPILRRLDIEYPQYAEASRNDEYLLGDGILVAPINEGTVKTDFDEGFFSYDDNGVVRKGLLGEYYNNTNQSGTPAYTKADTKFVLDWGLGGPAGLSSDNFSIHWSGNFTVGKSAMKFSFFADDRVQVRIDGKVVVNSAAGDTNQYDVLFETDSYEAGSTHSIEIIYVEEGNYAHFYMYGTAAPIKGASYCYDTREVFFPDGTWVDVWSGKEYEGPYTYSVTHPLETSPIFVRKGTLNVLAPDMTNLSEKDWSELTLDAYPAASRAEATLYEDDTTSQAYKYGEYRTTLITAEAVGGKYTIHFGAAEGTFKGAKAFTSRTWNVRLHAFEELGEVTSITVNGKRVSGIRYYAQNSLASPFSFTGASADTAVYQFSFTGNVDEETTVVVEFVGSANLAQIGKNPNYNAAAADFTISAPGSIDGYLDLDDEAYEDWAFFGNGTSRKGGATHVIGEITSDFELYANEASAVCASWTWGEGEGADVAEFVSTATRGQVDVNVPLIVKAGGPKVFTLYLTSEQCIGKLTVRDRAGNVRTCILDDPANAPAWDTDSDFNVNYNGASARKVTITVSAQEDTVLYVRYSVFSSVKDSGAGTGSAARVGISAIVYGDEEATTKTMLEPEPAILDMTAAPQTANLSEVPSGLDGEVLDWYKTNAGDGEVYMAGGDIIGAVTGSKFNPFGDYATTISWSDGEGTATGSTRAGYHTDANSSFTVTFAVDENTKYIVLYVGAWNSSTLVTLYNYKGDEKGSKRFSAGDPSSCQRIVIPITVSGETVVSVRIASVNAASNGNASLAAIQVIGNKNG